MEQADGCELVGVCACGQWVRSVGGRVVCVASRRSSLGNGYVLWAAHQFFGQRDGRGTGARRVDPNALHRAGPGAGGILEVPSNLQRSKIT